MSSAPSPGDTGGDCPRCGDPLRMVGYGESCVLGGHCEHCDLMLGLAVDVMTMAEAAERYRENEEHDVESEHEGHSTDEWGPDPWG